MPISTSTKIGQYITSLNSCLYAWRFLQYAWSTCFLICSYTLREDAVETHWARRARCVHAVDAQWQLFARHEHAVSAPWIRSQSPVRSPWECGGTPWALLGNATVAVGAPWHLHVMENVKLFAIFFSIFVWSHGALTNFKSPWDRSRVWQGLNDRHVAYFSGEPTWHWCSGNSTSNDHHAAYLTGELTWQWCSGNSTINDRHVAYFTGEPTWHWCSGNSTSNDRHMVNLTGEPTWHWCSGNNTINDRHVANFTGEPTWHWCSGNSTINATWHTSLANRLDIDARGSSTINDRHVANFTGEPTWHWCSGNSTINDRHVAYLTGEPTRHWCSGNSTSINAAYLTGEPTWHWCSGNSTCNDRHVAYPTGEPTWHWFCEITGWFLYVISISDSCHHSWASVTPVKYECDTQSIITVIWLWENLGW